MIWPFKKNKPLTVTIRDHLWEFGGGYHERPLEEVVQALALQSNMTYKPEATTRGKYKYGPNE